MATLTNASNRPLECKYFLYFRERHRSVMATGEVVTLPADFLAVVNNRYKPRLRRAYAAAVAGGLVTYAETMQQSPEAAEPVVAVEPEVVAAEPVVEEVAVPELADAETTEDTETPESIDE